MKRGTSVKSTSIMKFLFENHLELIEVHFYIHWSHDATILMSFSLCISAMSAQTNVNNAKREGYEVNSCSSIKTVLFVCQ